MKKIYYTLLLLLTSLGIYAQTTVSGIVLDDSGNSIPFANIIFKDTQIGAYSAENGTFYLETDKTYRTIVVSSIGFAEKEITLEKAVTKNLKIILQEGEQLSEVVIIAKPKKVLSKKENPAYKILQKIWANKKHFGLSRVNYYQYKRYKTLEIGLNNIDTTFLKTALGSEHQNVKDILSKDRKKERFIIPMYLEESIETVYGNNKLENGIERVKIEAERSKGVVDRGFGMERISKAMKPFNIYDNSLMVLDKPFVSPISEYGYGTYLYVLSDTIVENDKKFYQIHFFPRVDEDLAFQGSFVVSDSIYTLKSIQMFTTSKTNINLVRGLTFEKEFEQLNDTTMVLKKDMYEGDFTFFSKNDKEKGLYVKNTINYNDYLLNEPKSETFYTTNIVQISKDQYAKSDSFWKENELKDRDLNQTKEVIDKIGNNRKVRGISDAIDMIGTGFVNIGNYFQLGSFWEAFSYNEVEGFRTRIGFRSFISTEDRFRTYLYGAYGTKDKKFKYGISAMYLLSQQPRIIIGGSYINDNQQLGGPTDFPNVNSLRMRLRAIAPFSRGENYYLTRRKKIHGIFDYAFHNNLHLAFMATHQQMKVADSENFSIAYQKDGKIYNDVTDFSTGVSIIYTPGRNVMGYGVEQRYGKNLFASYSLSLTTGIDGFANGNFDYTKIEASVSYPITVRQFGLLKTTFDAGKIFGEVPLSLLAPTPSNQTYSNTHRTFSLLDYYDLVTDSYVNGFFEHHFNGYIFNKIPLLKKTKLRAVLLANFAYGTISNKNIKLSHSNIIYTAPERLYWEYGFGLENIGYGNFRPIRVDFLWRSSYNDINGVKNPNWGMRITIFPEF